MSADRTEYDLAEVSMRGWHERFSAELPDRDVLEQVFGERGMGYLMLVGARVESVALDPSDPPGSSVDARLGDGRLARGPARLVVRRAVEALVEQIGADGPTPRDGTADSIRAFLGARFLLVIAMHGIEAERLVLPRDGVPLVHLMSTDGLVEAELPAIRAIVARLLREDAEDLDAADVSDEVLSTARSAFEAGDLHTVVATLEAVIGPVASSLRSGHAAQLPAPERARLVDVVRFLGAAYARKGDAPAAETVLRLGAQGCRGEREAGPLFAALGDLAMERGEPGEAIGLYLRAEKLGCDPALYAPRLVEALYVRGRVVAALGVLDRVASVVPAAALAAARRDVESRLGELLSRMADEGLRPS